MQIICRYKKCLKCVIASEMRQHERGNPLHRQKVHLVADCIQNALCVWWILAFSKSCNDDYLSFWAFGKKSLFMILRYFGLSLNMTKIQAFTLNLLRAVATCNCKPPLRLALAKLKTTILRDKFNIFIFWCKMQKNCI